MSTGTALPPTRHSRARRQSSQRLRPFVKPHGTRFSTSNPLHTDGDVELGTAQTAIFPQASPRGNADTSRSVRRSTSTRGGIHAELRPSSDTKEEDEAGDATPARKQSRRSIFQRVRRSAKSTMRLFPFQQVRRWRNRSKNRALTKNSGVPLREGLQILYRIRRAKFLCELCLFVVFFAAFLLVIFQAYDVHTSWSQDVSVMDLFMDEEFDSVSYKKNFYEIMTKDEFWQWMQGPLLAGLYQSTYYNGDTIPDDEQGYILGSLRLVGGVELRQMRVSNSSCSERRYTHFGERFDTKTGVCYAEFKLGAWWTPWLKDTEDTTPFGPPSDPNKYTFVKDLGSSVSGLWGFGPSTYGTGGYPVYLPAQGLANATAIVDSLFNDRWVDEGTRAVAVTFSAYNTNSRLLTVSRFLVEFFSTGAVQPSWTVRSLRLILYESRWGQARLIGELAMVLMFAFMLQKEARRFWSTHPRAQYFFLFRSWFEMLFFVVNGLTGVYWLMFILSAERDDFDVNVAVYHDYFDLGATFAMTFTFAGFACLVACLKLFKFSSINKRMNTMWLTLQRASMDLFLFGLGTMVILTGFSLTGNMLFGSQLRDFHNMASSFSTLSRFTLGDFDYTDLSLARPRIAFIFFWMFNIVVFILIMNMFIAIILKTFENVHEETRAAEGWKHGMADLSFDAIKESRRLCRFYCTGRCPRLWHYLRCKCCCHAGVSRRTKQLEVWQAEAEVVQAFRYAARAAKHRDRSIDLFTYFDRAYREHRDKANIFMGLDELCAITRNTADRDRCIHVDCVARRVVQSYTDLKHVTLVHGVERTTGKVNINRLAEYVPTKWEVVKINKWGKKQTRILRIDRKQKEIHSFDTSGVMKRALPLSDLLQIEKSLVDEVRVQLVFAELLKTQYLLIFVSPRERQSFCEGLMEVLADVDDSETKPLGTSRSTMGSSSHSHSNGVDAALARVGVLGDKVSGLQAGMFDLRRELRSLNEQMTHMSHNIGAVLEKVAASPARQDAFRAMVPRPGKQSRDYSSDHSHREESRSRSTASDAVGGRGSRASRARRSMTPPPK